MRSVVILGGGPAGLTAAIYAARANLKPLVIEGSQTGGQLMQTTAIENFPGFADGVQGPELMRAMREQAERVGAELLQEDAVAIDFTRRPFLIRTHGGQDMAARAVIAAMGASARLLGLPSEQQFLGRGVSTCATCDGFFFRGRDVIVVGGGDTAMEEALYLANLARSATIVHRGGRLRASKIMQAHVMAHPKVQVLYNQEVVEILGNGKVDAVRLRGRLTGEITVRPADGVFVAIGHRPNTDLFRGQLELDDAGYIVLKNRMGSSVAGVFVAGDIHDHAYRQAITAAAFGAMAAIDAERWLRQAEIEASASTEPVAAS
jgi:thioredoxin reductase (NADPH)